MNPNTKNCSLFRTSVDAAISFKIYKSNPVIHNEFTDDNPWGIRFMSTFHMANDSNLFFTKNEISWSQLYLPLYEAKMIWHFDHRFGSFAGINKRVKELPECRLQDYSVVLCQGPNT
jgi:hypothetical protein